VISFVIMYRCENADATHPRRPLRTRRQRTRRRRAAEQREEIAALQF
jgi:hypothetical protein